MAKMKKESPWDNCEYALFPLGKGMPICAYGVEIPKGEEPSLKYFYHCFKNGKCRKELQDNNKRSEKMGSLVGALNKGKVKANINISKIRPNPQNKYAIDGDEVRSIAESIYEHGQLEPGIVYAETSEYDDKDYTLISGEKRYSAITLLVNEGKHNGDMEVIINDKPENDIEMRELINDANLQRKKDHKTLYFEIKQKYEYYQYLKEKGRKPEMHKRDWTAKALGISSRQVDNIIKKFEGEKNTGSNLASGRKDYNKNFAQKIKEKYNFDTKISQKSITFNCESTEELNDLLSHFGIDMTYDYQGE